jgi:hypothetical protein
MSANTHIHKSPKSLAKQGIPGQNKEKRNYDKNTICLPRQETNFLLKVLYLLGFEQYSIGF